MTVLPADEARSDAPVAPPGMHPDSTCQMMKGDNSAGLHARLGRPTRVLAPMVDQSELPFRLLARRYGAQLCYTPMLNSNQFVRAPNRAEMLEAIMPEDRPLIVQFAGHDIPTLLEAAKYVEHMCDAVDLNLGCPQGIARRGRYGSYLLEEEDLVVEIVRTLASNLSIPVTCKIRLFRNDLDRTLRLVRRLQDAGCAMLTVHGRTRYQNKLTTGACNFDGIACVKAALQIPVLSNGGVATSEDLERCMRVTGVDGVMSSEAALENPALFCCNRDAEGAYVDQNRLAREYLDLAEQYLPRVGRDGTAPKCVKAHMFKLLYMGLQDNTDLRDRVADAKTLEDYRAVAEELEARGWEQPMFHREEYQPERSWYYRHRLDEFGLGGAVEQSGPDAGGAAPGDDDDGDEVCWATSIFDEEE